MAEAPPTRSLSTLRSRLDAGTTYMVVGTLAAAAAAYAFQLLGGRVLGPTDFSPITLLWTIQFLAFSIVFVPMEQLTVRRLSLGRPGAAPWPLYLSVITATAVGATVFAALALDRFFTGDPGYLPIVAGLVLAYGGYEVARGFLAGHRRFKEYGLVTLLESLLRLALAGALISLGFGALGLGWTMVVGALVIWLWRPLRGQHARRGGGRPEAGEVGALATFITANAAAQTIVAAGPLAVGALGGTPAEVSIFFQTTLMLRAPLAVAYGLTSRVLPPFTRFVEQGESATIRRLVLAMGAAGAALGTAAFVAGYAVGPALVELLLGAEYRPTPLLAAAAAAGAALATVALFAQQMLIAMRATGRLAAAWLAGLAAAVVVIAVAGGSPSIRVGWGFLVGETVAFPLILGATLRGRRR